MENIEIISATEAARSFSDLLHRVHYQHQSFIIKKGGRVMARMVPGIEDRPSTKDLLDWLNARENKLSEQDWQEHEEAIATMRKLPPQFRWSDEQ